MILSIRIWAKGRGFIKRIVRNVAYRHISCNGFAFHCNTTRNAKPRVCRNANTLYLTYYAIGAHYTCGDVYVPRKARCEASVQCMLCCVVHDIYRKGKRKRKKKLRYCPFMCSLLCNVETIFQPVLYRNTKVLRASFP